MIYLSGVIREKLIGLRDDLGVMENPDSGNVYDRTLGPWAVENACFSKGSDFALPRYLARLDALHPYRATCLFAPAPDVVGDATATWARSRDVLPAIRDRGFKAALVAQDGIERQTVEWGALDVLFLGGSTKFKLSHHARELVTAAHDKGKYVHMGRVNSERRFVTAFNWGCDSVDGTFLAFGPDINTPQLIGWLDRAQKAPGLIFSKRRKAA